MKITLELLEEKGACRGERGVFARLFPQGVTPTRELCRKHAQDFDLDWAADYLLSEDAYEAYEAVYRKAGQAREVAGEPMHRAYREVVDPAWAVFLEAAKQADVDRDAVRRAYHTQIQEAARVLGEALAPVSALYYEATRDAFYDAWVIDHPEDSDAPVPVPAAD